MATEFIKCPHCECKVSVSEVEKEDGTCPECGQLVLPSKLFDDYDDFNDEDDLDEAYLDDDDFFDDDDLDDDDFDDDY